MRAASNKFVVLFAFAIFFTGFAQAEESPQFVFLGQFSNYRFTEEHQYGAGIALWQDGKTPLGLFSYSEGLIGDTPTGLLEKLSFDRKTGKISFTAKLTMGRHYCKVHNDVPSQDLFTFEGVMRNKTISGKLTQADGLHLDQAPTDENVVLKAVPKASAIQYTNRNQWESIIRNILKFRGPKW